MGVLSMYLPPFSPDYSGVCSALFDLNALIVIHDAAGCTGNYTGFDEPRWYGSKKAIYCSGLRKMDAVMGEEQKFIDRIKSALATNPDVELIALVGSPVPMVIGTDFDGLAREVENQTGIPALGFAANGTNYYNEGVFWAAKALIERFKEPGGMKTGVNILGATPLDISNETLQDIKTLITQRGYSLNACFCMGLTLEQVRCALHAKANIAISQSGLKIARYLYDNYGMPYLAGLPFGASPDSFFLALQSVYEDRRNIVMENPPQSGETIILGDEVGAHSLALALRSDHIFQRIDVGAIFGKERGVYSGSIALSDEQQILESINSGAYSAVIADPLICGLISCETVHRIPVAHFAVSSRFYKRYAANLIAQNTKQFIEERLQDVQKEYLPDRSGDHVACGSCGLCK